MTKLSVCIRFFTNIFVTFLFTVCFVLLFSGNGMAIIEDGFFDDSSDSADLRANDPDNQDWYESRGDGEDGPRMLELD